MLEIGQKAPDFALPGVDDANHSLAALLADHKVVAVIFSCNHCPYVRAWEERMVAIQRDYAARGAALVAINPNDTSRYPDDDFDSMKARAAEQGFNFPYLRDETQEVARAYGATHTPHVFLLDAGGVLRYQGAIDDSYEDPGSVEFPYLRDALEAVLAGQTPRIAVSDAVGCTIKWERAG
ncbi:MAG: thioredoxin family protein [Anaerolineae bacterium]|nr:thioredoxin family protein [Anaerolineae bacterium]